jgi:hypothetical protein
MIRHYLPDFCWQTGYQILTMLEQIDENVREEVVFKTLSIMSARGELDRKIVPNLPGMTANQYHLNVTVYKLSETPNAGLARKSALSRLDALLRKLGLPLESDRIVSPMRLRMRQPHPNLHP